MRTDLLRNNRFTSEIFTPGDGDMYVAGFQPHLLEGFRLGGRDIGGSGCHMVANAVLTDTLLRING